MQFYHTQGSYSHKDINHIKLLLFWISKEGPSFQGWESPSYYIRENKIAYDIDKCYNRYANEYLSIYCRWPKYKKRILLLSDILAIGNRTYNYLKLHKSYLIKIGFYRHFKNKHNY